MQSLVSDIISSPLVVRPAVAEDIPVLMALMEQSVRRLNVQNYSEEQVESALVHVYGIDEQLIADGTYYVAEFDGVIAGCGGWSRHGKLIGGNQVQSTHKDAQLGASDAAQIRAMFVHPNYARRGVGTRLMEISEMAARRAGFRRLELIATLTGEPLYRKFGFVPIDTVDLLFPNGVSLRTIKMAKELP